MMRLTHICTMFMSLVWFVGRVPIFQKAYAQHAQRLDDDRWLHKQCSDPQFFTRMRQHADVCDTVRTSFRTPAMLAGLQACLPAELRDMLPDGWRAVALGALLMLAAPSVLLPMCRSHSDRRWTLPERQASHKYYSDIETI